MQAQTVHGRKKKKAVFLLVLGVLLLVVGVASLFMLQGKSIQFDRNFDNGGDLSAYPFGQAAEDGSYSSVQRAALFLLRNRAMVMLFGVILIALFVVPNRELLYSQKLAPYVFIAPFVITFAVFFAYPLISTVLMSFQEITGSGTTWIGLKNYQDMFANKNFYTAVQNSATYMVLTCAILIPVPMILAYIADAMVLLCFWRWTGMNMLYYMAGLKSIPNELYEAAEIDGANSFQKFTKICLPLLKPTTIYVLTISIYAGLAMFTESYMIFGGNNSPKNYGLTIVGYLYRYGFEKVDKFGFASAVGLVLLAGCMIITVLQLWFTGTIGRKGEKA